MILEGVVVERDKVKLYNLLVHDTGGCSCREGQGQVVQPAGP